MGMIPPQLPLPQVDESGLPQGMPANIPAQVPPQIAQMIAQAQIPAVQPQASPDDFLNQVNQQVQEAQNVRGTPLRQVSPTGEIIPTPSQGGFKGTIRRALSNFLYGLGAGGAGGVAGVAYAMTPRAQEQAIHERQMEAMNEAAKRALAIGSATGRAMGGYGAFLRGNAATQNVASNAKRADAAMILAQARDFQVRHPGLSNPINSLLNQAFAAEQSGDIDTYNRTLDLVNQASLAKNVSDINQYTRNYLAANRLDDTPQARLQAHQAFTDETKTQPGIARMNVLAQTRGMPITDNETGITAPISWRDYNILSKQFPGRYSSPQFDNEIQAGLSGAKVAGKEIPTQVQSFRAFLGHADDLANAAKATNLGSVPWANVPLVELRNRAAGDPQITRYLAKIEPVRKEFESFLLNNRALYSEDRAQGEKIISESATPQQMQAAIESLTHTAYIRLDALNQRAAETGASPVILDKKTKSILERFGNDTSAFDIANARRRNARSPLEAAGVAPPANLLKEGKATTFKNGQTWTLKSGVPFRVK